MFAELHTGTRRMLWLVASKDLDLTRNVSVRARAPPKVGYASGVDGRGSWLVDGLTD